MGYCARPTAPSGVIAVSRPRLSPPVPAAPAVARAAGQPGAPQRVGHGAAPLVAVPATLAAIPAALAATAGRPAARRAASVRAPGRRLRCAASPSHVTFGIII